MLVNARNIYRWNLRCQCCGSPKLRSASRRKTNARYRDAERRAIRRTEKTARFDT